MRYYPGGFSARSKRRTGGVAFFRALWYSIGQEGWTHAAVFRRYAAFSRTNGRRNGLRLPHGLRAAWRGRDRNGDGLLPRARLSGPQEPRPAPPERGLAVRRADLRQRPGHDGRGRADRRRHQQVRLSGHQYGLPHAEDRQQRRRQRPHARHPAGRAHHPRRGGRPFPSP